MSYCIVGAALAAAIGVALATPDPLPTTVNDFYLRGTQPTPPFIEGEPNPAMHEFFEPLHCAACHGEYAEAEEPYSRWQHSIMAQAFRDPVFRAAFSIAQQDAPGSGDTCLRCHTPAGWTQDRNVPADGSALTFADKEGVTCHHCHRQVDPVYEVGVNPPQDATILANLGIDAPGATGNGYVIDHKDRRRGPFDISPFELHDWLQSPFHAESAMCASCHDTSNPAYARQADGTYLLTAHNQAHPTGNKYDMFPEQRTYSEWLQSDFADGPVELGSSRFGGQRFISGQIVPQTSYSTCQDCHMPKVTGVGCNPFLGSPVRHDLAQHNFNGANTWVLQAVEGLYAPEEHHMDPLLVQESVDRNLQMLAQASDLEVTQDGAQIVARVINQTGHKLPTGYPEGRRMWLNVRFLDQDNQVVYEHGHYDQPTAVLSTADTKVYETQHGIDSAVAAATGLPPGKTFHLTLNNVIIKDNRIPPRGFTNAGFASVQAEPVGYAYADGQYWDDTVFPIPAGATKVEVRVYYQTSSKEYMEFLRDEDTTIPFDAPLPWGTIAYDAWDILGKSAPALMDEVALDLAGPSCAADFNGDGFINPDDLSDFITCFFLEVQFPGVCPQADFNADVFINPDDLSDFITTFFLGC